MQKELMGQLKIWQGMLGFLNNAMNGTALTIKIIK